MSLGVLASRVNLLNGLTGLGVLYPRVRLIEGCGGSFLPGGIGKGLGEDTDN